MNLFQTRMQIIPEFARIEAITDRQVIWDFLLYFLTASPNHKETVPKGENEAPPRVLQHIAEVTPPPFPQKKSLDS